MNTSGRSTIILLDANVWIKERLLRSAIGVAVLYSLGRSGIKMALPNVIRREAIAGILKAGRKAASDVENGLSTLQAITRSKPAIKLPSEDDLLAAAEKRFAELQHHLIEIDHSPEQMARALDRVIAGRSPSARKEQFRDALLWECALEISSKHDVLFVTRDDDFVDAKPGTLASGLEKELSDGSRKLTLFADAADVLAAITDRVPPLNYDYVANLILEAVNYELHLLEEKHGIIIGGLTWQNLAAFATEEVDTLAVSFRINLGTVFPGTLNAPETVDGVVIVAGECFYNTRTDEVLDVNLDRIQIHSPTGEPKGAVYLQANMGGESRAIPYKVRHPIDGARRSTETS